MSACISGQRLACQSRARVLEEISSNGTTATIVWLCLSPSRMPTSCIRICRAVVDIRPTFHDSLGIEFETSGAAEPLVLLWKSEQSSRDAWCACWAGSACIALVRPRMSSLAATNDGGMAMPFHASVQLLVAHAMTVCCKSSIERPEGVVAGDAEDSAAETIGCGASALRMGAHFASRLLRAGKMARVPLVLSIANA